MITRRKFLKLAAASGAAVATSLYCPGSGLVGKVLAGNGANVPKQVDPFSEIACVDSYVKERLDNPLPGCKYITFGDVTTDGYRKGVYVPETFEKLFVMINSASVIERFIEPRLERVGVYLDKEDVKFTSGFRPFWKDKELSPFNDNRRVHPECLAIDFGSWKFLDKEKGDRFYHLCDMDWDGGFKRTGTNGTTFHIDTLWDRERRFGRYC